MTLTIDLPSDVEADLLAQAQVRGLDLSEFVEQVLRERSTVRTGISLTPTERAEAWRNSVRDLPISPPLSDEAISRERIYGDRGV